MQAQFPALHILSAHLSPSRRNYFPDIMGLDHQYIRGFPRSEYEKLDSESDSALKDGTAVDFSFKVNIRDALDASQLPFFGTPAPYAISLAKITRKAGSKVELTGDDAYRSLTLPLLKAADHLQSLSIADSNKDLYFPRIVISLAVLRAPMACAFLDNGDQKLVSLPWVRMSYLEPRVSRSPDRSVGEFNGRMRYYDVVHESCLPRYLETLARDADILAERMHQHSEELVTGLGEWVDHDDGSHTLHPFPESYRKYLDTPCAVDLYREADALQIDIDRTRRLTERKHDNIIEWIDDNEWLSPEKDR